MSPCVLLTQNSYTVSLDETIFHPWSAFRSAPRDYSGFHIALMHSMNAK